MPNKFYQIKRWTSSVETTQKSAMPIKNSEGLIVDYRDVTIEGYLSTFVNKTFSDRIGDYILPGAFAETVGAFKKNPVSLIDHENKVFSSAGQFLELGEDREGLKFVILLTNAADMAGLRVRVVEKVIRATSMGGFFYYLDDGNGIYKVDLFEGSIVAVPTNPDALFSVRSLTLSEFQDVAKFAQAENAASELLQSTIAGRIVAPDLVSKALELLPKKINIAEPQRKRMSVGGLKILKGESHK